MSDAAASSSPANGELKAGRFGSSFDPDNFRMSVGDHLEELRSRLIKAVLGAFVAFFGCLIVAKQYLLPVIAGPLIQAHYDNELNPQLYFTGVTDPFFVYLRLSMIGAFVIAGPWLIWQAWGFVASGLYKNERRAITKFLPLSLALFFGGIAFVWFFILPITLSFFLGWAMTIPLPASYESAAVVDVEPGTIPQIPVLAGDPADPPPMGIWFDSTLYRLKVYLPHDGTGADDATGEVRVIPFSSANLAAPIITLPDYVNLVLVLLIVFGLSFQLPLAVMAVIRGGLVDAEVLRRQRRVVYFAMVFLACAITPGDIITATVGLIGPLILLYEIGIWLGERGRRGVDAAET